MSRLSRGIMACILAVCALFVGCQPTPELAPVVNKREDAIEQAAKKEENQPQETQAAQDEQADTTMPVEYEATGRWQETIEKADFFTVEADVDIMMPAVSQYPIEKLKLNEMTQEQVDKMLAYFVPEGAKFYEYPLPPTKEYYEKEIISLKQSLANVQAGGDGETPEAIQSYIDEAEANYAKAPEQLELKYVEPVYGYEKNYQTWEEDTASGKNAINIALADESGGAAASIWASRYEQDVTYGNGFGYGGGIGMSENEIYIKDRERWLSQDEAWIKNISEDDPYRAEETRRLQKERAYLEEVKAALAANSMDMEAVKGQAAALFAELGIKDVQITECVKAVYEPQKLELSWDYYDPNSETEQKAPTQNACYIEFSRECGGVPVKVQTSGSWNSGEERAADTYSSPFYAEAGSMLINAQGEVVDFYWHDAAEMVERVAADAELISIEEVKKRAVDQLFFSTTSWMTQMDEDGMEYTQPKMRFVVENAELVMTYVNVKDDPNSMLAVPAWRIGAQGYETYPADEYYDGSEVMANYEEVFINALDGGVILMPGMDRHMREMEEEPELTAAPEAV